MKRNPLSLRTVVWVILPLIGYCATGLTSQPTLGQQLSDRGEVAFARSIEILPLQDLRVATFTLEWAGEGPRPYGAFYNLKDFLPEIEKPVKELWNKGLIELDVNTGRSFCGWWLNLNGLDWSEYLNWKLALRVRFSEETFRRFKVELKNGERGDSPRLTYFVDLENDELSDIRGRGFGDIVIPLRSGVGNGSLRGLQQLVLVFESDRVETADGKPGKGRLALHSIRLVPPRIKKVQIPARQLLDDLAARAFSWFETYRDPKSGLIPDRATNWRSVGSPEKAKSPCSIASVGYYLSMLPDAAKTKRLSEEQARERAVTVLRFIETNAEQHSGFLHHFLDMDTGKPVPDSEVSVLDSAILFNGCMVASQHFGGDVAEVADRLLDRVNWAEFRSPAEANRPELLAMAWDARRGLHGPMDVRSTEFAMAYFLAAGAAKNAVDPSLWWNTGVKRGQVEGRRILNPTHSLFTSYYGLGWHMLQGRVDVDGVDFWENARSAVLANRAFCRGTPDETYQLKWGGWWGISAGDSPRGYIAPGPAAGDAGGTVWPTAAMAALPWASQEIEEDLLLWAQSPVWEYVAGPFGLAPFNLKKSWIGTDLIGIDLGSFYLAVANHRRASVWDLWKQHPIGRRAIERIYGKQ